MRICIFFLFFSDSTGCCKQILELVPYTISTATCNLICSIKDTEHFLFKKIQFIYIYIYIYIYREREREREKEKEKERYRRIWYIQSHRRLVIFNYSFLMLCMFYYRYRTLFINTSIIPIDRVGRVLANGP